MVTTTSSTSSATTIKQNATSALLQSLGAGSGIDMTALATNLAAAQFATKNDRIAAQAETLEKQISAASTLKSAISNLAMSLGDRVRNGDLSAQPQIANSLVAKTSLSGTPTAKGSYSLEVSSLATAQTLASPAFASGTSTFGAGTLSIKFGTTSGGTFSADAAHTPLDITVEAGATLNDVANLINGKNAGITAYVSNTTEGAKLVLKGTSGDANSFVVETTGDTELAKLAWDPATPGTNRLLTTAGNANFKLDGLSITSASNTIEDAIPGVTLSLTGTNVGSPTTVSFNDPSSAIAAAMSDLTSALNEIASSLNELTDSKTGELSRDSGALALKRSFQQLTNTVIMPNAPEGTPRTLSELGVSLQRDGSFTFDSARLTEALKADSQAVGAMFTTGLYGIYATIDDISRKAAVSSNPASLAGSISRMTELQTKLSEDQTKLAEKQETLRMQLVSRFSYADSAVGASKSTLSFLKNQIAAWNNSGD